MAVRFALRRILPSVLVYAALLNGPTEIALTFCDHYDPAVTGVRQGRYLRFLGAFPYEVEHPQWLKDLCGE